MYWYLYKNCIVVFDDLVTEQCPFLFQLFSRYGQVEKIVTFNKNSEYKVFHLCSIDSLKNKTKRTVFKFHNLLLIFSSTAV